MIRLILYYLFTDFSEDLGTSNFFLKVKIEIFPFNKMYYKETVFHNVNNATLLTIFCLDF